MGAGRVRKKAKGDSPMMLWEIKRDADVSFGSGESWRGQASWNLLVLLEPLSHTASSWVYGENRLSTPTSPLHFPML